MKRNALLVVLLLVAATVASFGQGMSVVGTSNSVVAGVMPSVQVTTPQINLSFGWVGIPLYPTSGGHLAEFHNIQIHTLPQTPTLFSVYLNNVDFRDKRLDVKGQRVYADFAMQRVGDNDDPGAYRHMRAQLIEDDLEIATRQPSGLNYSRIGRGLDPGCYNLVVRFYLAKYERLKPLGDLPILGRMTTASRRSGMFAYYTIPLVVHNLIGFDPKCDEDYVDAVKWFGGNPIDIRLPKPAQDQSAAFTTAIQALQAQIQGLREKLDAVTARPDLPEFREQAKPGTTKTKPTGDGGEGGQTQNTDATGVPPDTSVAGGDAVAPSGDTSAPPAKTATPDRKVMMSFTFVSERGDVLTSQEGEVCYTLVESMPRLERPAGTVVTANVRGGARFEIGYPVDGKSNRWLQLSARKAGSTYWAHYRVRLTEAPQTGLTYICRR